jgi:SWI/SNF-related matrix-associated actin-dependent regulator 1 of chromatin subfamily A
MTRKTLKLLPYQEEGVQFLKSHARALLADDMGLGKTIQAIAYINSLAKMHDILIVCPAVMRGTWLNELRAWLDKPYGIVRLETTYLPLMHKPCVYVLSYDSIRNPRVLAYLKKRSFAIAVCDESHYMKNREAKRTQAVLASGLKSSRWVFMSGTPVTKSPTDLWPILAAAAPECLGAYKSYNEFYHRYCKVYIDDNGRERVAGAQNLDELRARLQPFMLRRTKTEVLKDLPDIFHQAVMINPTKKIKDLLKQEHDAERSLRLKDIMIGSPGEAWRKALQENDAHMMSIRRELGEEKLVHILEAVDNILCQTNKLVIFCHHKKLVKDIEASLQKDGISYVTLTGETPYEQRQDAITRFQSDPNCQVFIGAISVSIGITLTAAHHILFAEVSFLPHEMEQAAARCHRLGQRKNVLVQYLLWEDSLEHWIFSNVLFKAETVHQIVNKKDEDNDE